MDDETFKDGVALTQSIPGATAMQMAAYAGLKSRGVGGALLSYIGFGLPAFVSMLILSALYGKSRNIAQIISLFNGLQVIVVAMVANAAYTFGRGTLKNYRDILIAGLSAILFLKGISPFIVIIGSALTGIAFLKDTGHMIPSLTRGVRDKQKVKQIILLVLVLLTGLLVLYFADTGLFKLAAIMLRIDIFAFGGGFASLPLMLHEVVNLKGWMDQRTFMDGIALGQITPGQIVITSTFVGYLTYGFTGAIVATIAIFTPSFLILVMAAPFFDKLKTSEYFSKATKGILASFVGLLLSVTLKFGLNVSWDIIRVLFGLAAMTALMKKADVLYVVLAGAVISLLIM